MALRRIIFTSTLFLILCVGCARQGAATPTSTEIPPTPSTAVMPTEMPQPTAVISPTITPEPTPLLPHITTSTQPLKEDGRLVIDSVISDEAGWLVLLSDVDGEAGDVLGYTAVLPGENDSVVVEIDPLAATPVLHAQLLRDAGDSGEFEYPGPDMAVEQNGRPVAADLALDIQLPIPLITAADQTIKPDGLVSIESVTVIDPGWLVVHSSSAEGIGPALGQIAVQPGLNENLSFPIRWQEASEQLVAMLYEDPEQPGGFDPSKDLPVLVGGSAVSAEFTVTLPPDIAVYDQPVVNGEITVERAISGGPGWLVVYTDQEDQLGIIIGFAPVHAGINELVNIQIVETAATPQLFLLLHDDTSDPTQFNFPAADPPAQYDGQLIAPVAMLTNPGNYLLTEDQTLGEENEVVVPLVVADLDTWLVVYTTTADGQPDEALGELWLPAGINRNNKVAISSRVIDEPLLAVLHRDAGTPQEFDYPAGDDVPLQRNRQIIQSPFNLHDPSQTGAFSPSS